MNKFFSGRHTGVLVPLFSMPSSRSWGIGEIGDIGYMAAWLRAGGQDLLQFLPINEMGGGQHSPYSALSAMAIDPIFITMAAVEDFAALGGEQAGSARFQRMLAEVRASTSIRYDAVRELKVDALRAAFERFKTAEWEERGSRAVALADYIEQQRWWLRDYAIFRAIHAQRGGQPWTSWPESIRRRDPSALERVSTELADDILFYQYLQWLAHTQWQAARAEAGAVGLFGDFPFMVSGDSADVWARSHDFRLDASVGVPPDAFSDTGQDWGLPVYRWSVIARGNYTWLRQRARRSADLYDAYRVDHLVGFYRTYVRPKGGGRRHFTPRDEGKQLELGERLLQILASAGPRVVAEDLGTVPAFVRASLDRLGIPGYKVLRWEREWDQPGKPFRDPAAYPECSLATSGTHDTDPMATWWEEASHEERAALGELPTLAGLDPASIREHHTPAIRDALLEALAASGSDFVILPIQDIFGWRDRINTPATVGHQNWTWRLPWLVDRLRDEPEAVERAARLRAWAEKYDRAGASADRAIAELT